MEKGDENSYRSILKGTSIFGGVQVFLVLINLIRGKFVAMILGPGGMGISSLFTATQNTINQAASLGLNLAIVKEVSQHKHDATQWEKVYVAGSTLIRITSLLGALFCVLFSGWLSETTFGSREYSWQFCLLAVSLFFLISGNGKLSILQGLHEIKRLSYASLVGALTGLFAGVPLYYFFGDKGIVPAICMLSFAMWLFYTLNLRQYRSKSRFSRAVHGDIAKRLLGMGLILVAGNVIGSACAWGINVWLRGQGGNDTVGLFQAANSVTNQYVGLIITALSLDYFPRLSAVSGDNGRMNEIVNRQTTIISLLAAPTVTLIIVTAPLVISLLLAESFQSILQLLRWMAVGSMLKLLQFPTGYVAFAKDNKKLFFILEGCVTNFLNVTTNILFFTLYGLPGLGIAVIVENAITMVIYAMVNYRLYGFYYNAKALRGIGICIMLCIGTFLASLISTAAISYTLMGAVTAIAVTYSMIRLIRIYKTAN